MKCQRHGEGRPGAGCALDGDIAAHDLRQPLDNGKAKTGSSELPCGRAIGLYEGLEEPGELLCAHPNAGVGHRERCARTAATER